MTNRYNIAACPVEARICDQLFEKASLFEGMADGYCLGKGRALPHLTLCQFSAEDDLSALRLAEPFLSFPLDIAPVGLYINPDVTGIRESLWPEALWIGYTALRAAALMALQSRILEDMTGKGVEVFTQKGDSYFPHFTLARVRRTAIEFPAAFFAKGVIGDSVGCRVCLGRSDPMGQFLHRVSDGHG